MTPQCPDCDEPMVERENHETGDVFWGCSLYPECKHTEPVDTYEIGYDEHNDFEKENKKARPERYF